MYRLSFFFIAGPARGQRESSMKRRLQEKKQVREAGNECFLIDPFVHSPRCRRKHCIIGALSVVNKDIPPYSLAVGSPARVVKQYDFDRGEWVKVSESERSLRGMDKEKEKAH